ncbi:centrosomal protein of 55 kDa [Clarias gariepinus]|uniref:centrosomal protein of 55 kDa n=1 Tax=Clarias gariepinus TaxID=13013 RepID=UPI00234C511E|nr:centrosomal protein of 55 kDa [Clarias gariepinus]XP_053366879.1 centrosomal protein of 55 kDa [Clarias gariepinus]
MASKGAKETLANKLGFKGSGSKAVEAELEKLKKENAHLKKTLDEMSKRNGRHQPSHPDSDKAKLLERILSLETLRERNAQQLLAKEQEISTMRQQLRAEGGEVVASLQNQLEKERQESENKEKRIQSLSQETEALKNKLVAVTEKFQACEKRSNDMQVPSGEIAVVEAQLRDALEKNQQWIVYDQQREVYVQGIFSRIAELEQQLNQAKQTLQQQHKEANSEGQSSASVQQEKQLQENQREIDEERKRVRNLQAELEEIKSKYEEKNREVVRAQEELLEERRSGRQSLAEERKLNSERVARLQSELEAADVRFEEERKRAAELLLQVNLLQKSLLTQHEDQKRTALLEQQIQLSARDFENEKLDRQSLQHQLHKVLKELRKARDQIARLESAKQQRETRFSEPSSYTRLDLNKMTSPLKSSSTLDESFLECPNCRASYPTSQHRELLAHLDYCFN